MTVTVATDEYGKGGVRIVKVVSDGIRDQVMDLTVEVRLRGRFADTYTGGDNSMVLPTDTMRNTVYAMAPEHLATDIEPYAVTLARHFLESPAPVDEAEVSIVQRPWARVGDRPHAFRQVDTGRRTTTVVAGPDGVAVSAGALGLRVLRTTGSAFEGFLVDGLTTLEPARDRLLSTEISAQWRYTTNPADLGATWHDVVQRLVEVFCDHDSKSVQHTLYAMGEAVLAQHPEIDHIWMSLPNKHHVPFDVARFGIAGGESVYYPFEVPHGVIEATIAR
jgi:urate oxidase